ncbi:DNA-binding transcriptional regulator, LysR family [Rhodospirillales bacterium URHD0017]|nr:DNA-binding transcriptional regulator, LysR family [Rhodospirillales bacterium URHD0017]
MDWNNLKFFLALAETGSLSGAAKQHRVDHSTVARRVEALEGELGVRLVERLARSYRITAEGERVREQARKVKAGIAEIVRLARDADISAERIVRVSGPPTLLSRFLAPRLLPLQKEHPGLRIDLLGDMRQVDLNQGEADLALRLMRPREKGIVARRVAVLGYGLYGSRERVARRANDQDYLGFDESLDHVPQQRWFKTLAGDRGFALRSNDLLTLMTSARAGLGLAVLPCIMASHEPELVRVPTEPPPPSRELWLVFHRDVGRSPAVRVVIDRITEVTTAARKAFLGGQR